MPTSRDEIQPEHERPQRLSAVARDAVAHRPALAAYRSAHTDMVREVRRYFDRLRERRPAAAAYIAAWSLLPDLKSLELEPGLSPGVRSRRHRLMRFFSDPAIREGLSGGPSKAISRIEVAVLLEIDDCVFGRGIHALFPESAELVME